MKAVWTLLMVAMALTILTPAPARAHCDTLDGPVVLDAKTALDKGDVTPVLKWVRAADEAEIREAFSKALAVRKLGADAKALADKSFFETLIRVHRAGEGAPYTGLKPAGSEIGPAVTGADASLASGSADAVVKLVQDATAEGIRHRFAKVSEARKHKDHNVQAGREYVEAYVQYVHFVEGLYEAAARPAAAHGHAEPEAHEHAHE